MEKDFRYYQTKALENNIPQSIIDAAGFYAGNALAGTATKLAKPKLSDGLVFLITDYVTRIFISPPDKKNLDYSNRGNYMLNGIIALMFLLTNSIVGLIAEEDVESTLTKNLVKAGVSFVSNSALDNVIRSPYL